MTHFDTEMFITDLSAMIDKYGPDSYPFPDRIGPDELRAALPAFFAALGWNPTIPPATQPPAADSEPFVRHTCNRAKPGMPLPWGRKAPEGECARCDQLRAGAAPRSAPPAILAGQERAKHNGGYPTEAERATHHAPGGPHATKCANTICTFGDW